MESTSPGKRGIRLARARRRIGLSQRDFAAQLGISESYVAKLERGARALSDVDFA